MLPREILFIHVPSTCILLLQYPVNRPPLCRIAFWQFWVKFDSFYPYRNSVSLNFKKGRLSLCDDFYILNPIKYKLLECEDIVFCFYSFDVYTITSDMLTNVPVFCIPTSLLWKAFIIVFCLQTLVSYTLGYIFFLVCPL